MNRAERRAFIKKAKQNGVSKEVAEAYLAAKTSAIPKFREDDKVRLNVQRIQSQPNYEGLNPRYKEFVETNSSTVFTVHVEKETLVSLKEQPEWLFWIGHLLPVEAESES